MGSSAGSHTTSRVRSHLVEKDAVTQGASGRPSRAVALVTLATGMGSGLFFTGASLLAGWGIVRLLSGPDLDAPGTTIITALTVAGGCAGSWWAQPVIPRVLAAAGRLARDIQTRQR